MKVSIMIALLVVGFQVAEAQNTFTLVSNEIGGQAEQAHFFQGFGCTGANESPQISWKNSPEGTQSYALTLYDKDAPTGSGWWHWQVINIPTSATEIPAKAGDVTQDLMPKGAVQIQTDYGTYGYGGPCPPEGDAPHQYVLTLYALDLASLELTKDTSSAIVGYMINSHVIEQASIVFYAKR
ncbi:MAG: YbhB/YbcL family Raf kinase inhibitor-like protein [Bacteroidota bacterium]